MFYSSNFYPSAHANNPTNPSAWVEKKFKLGNHSEFCVNTAFVTFYLSLMRWLSNSLNSLRFRDDASFANLGFNK